MSASAPLPAAAADVVVLHPDEVQILRALSYYRVSILVSDLAGLRRVDLSRRTLGKRLDRLRAAGLTARPFGDRSGEIITDAGREVLRQLPDDDVRKEGAKFAR